MTPMCRVGRSPYFFLFLAFPLFFISKLFFFSLFSGYSFLAFKAGSKCHIRENFFEIYIDAPGEFIGSRIKLLTRLMTMMME